MVDQPEKDEHTGTETTGHEWDGIKELNTPLPRWWLWIFYATVIWSVGYWIVYPAFPTLSGDGERGGTKGAWEWTQYKELDESRQEIVERRGEYLVRFNAASFDAIQNDKALYAFAMAGGAAAFKDNCATCHGTGGAGAPGYPNLNDDDWIWAGDIDGIYQTIKYGIRMHEDARDSMMPAYEGLLSNEEIHAVARFVKELRTGADLESEGAAIYAQHCATCHGEDGKGIRELGAPNLADAIWLKSGGSVEAIISQIKQPKHGMMPAFDGRLDDATLRQLAIYVHSLGGGE